MDSEQPSLFIVGIDETTQSHLIYIAKWNKFLAIAGIAASGFTLLILIFGGKFFINNLMAAQRNSLESEGYQSGMFIFLLVFYSFCIAIFLIPCFFRLNFANKMLKAISSNDQQLLNESLRHFKTYSIYWGIITIISLACYLFFFVAIAISLMAIK